MNNKIKKVLGSFYDDIAIMESNMHKIRDSNKIAKLIFDIENDILKLFNQMLELEYIIDGNNI